jgi:polyadenylate-binding protein
MTGKNLTVVDETQPCTSALYGFVCFENEEDAKKVIGSDQFGAIQAIKFSPKDPKDIKRLSNNVYIKNFDAKWDESKFAELFGKYGKIKSIFIKEDSTGPGRKFAFVCFEDPQDREAGFVAAEKAVQELNEKEFDGTKLYVQPALNPVQRQGMILREQQRFKNSKKKCNLFVKNFPANYKEEDLRNLFSKHGEIESIKIIASHDTQTSTRAFVCFKQPDMAALARSYLHGFNLESK